MTEESVVWAYRRSVPQLPSPLVYEDVLYMLNDSGGLITTFHAKSGEVIERGRLTDAVESYYASLVAGDGKVYLVSETGIVTVLPAGGSLTPIATSHLDAECHATPALADGRIYLRTETALYRRLRTSRRARRSSAALSGRSAGARRSIRAARGCVG